jgi:hypothetical protein
MCQYTGTVSDSTSSVNRRLAAILAADIAGYSREHTRAFLNG